MSLKRDLRKALKQEGVPLVRRIIVSDAIVQLIEQIYKMKPLEGYRRQIGILASVAGALIAGFTGGPVVAAIPFLAKIQPFLTYGGPIVAAIGHIFRGESEAAAAAAKGGTN